jgi:hypothetical protein
MIDKIINLANSLDSLGLSGEADKLDILLTASRSRRQEPERGWGFRHPGGHRHRADPEVRPGARPPDAWDDKGIGRANYAPRRAIRRMLDKGYSREQILERLTSQDGKWLLSHSEASRALDLETDKFERYIKSLSPDE